MVRNGTHNPGPPSCVQPRHRGFLLRGSTLSGCAQLLPPDFRLFSPPFRGAFQLSLTVLVHYRSQDIFSLGGWSLQLQTGFLVPRPTRVINDKVSDTWRTGLSPSLASLSKLFCSPRSFFTLHQSLAALVVPSPALDKSRSELG